jgi:tripartite-type tricarboxylate transporter receptor subunit TctC
MRYMTRRFCAIAAGLTFALGSAAVAQAQTQPAWPTKPVRMLLGLSPGSGSDLLARAMAQRLTATWGQPVVVENRPGANTIVATEAVAKAAPDGHTLLFSLDGAFTINPHLYAKLPYDALKDFAPITMLTIFPTVLLAHPSVSASSLPDLVALAKKEPGKLTYGSWGSGSQAHLVQEMLNNRAGMSVTHVPYKGIPQMTTAALGGEVQLCWVGVFTSRPLVQSGRMKAIATSGTKRSPLMPDVPSLVELGYPEAEMSTWYALHAPAGTPRPIVDRIHADVQKLMAEPEFREKEMMSKGYEPSTMGPDELAAYVRREFASRAPIVKVSGARAE